MRRAVVRRTKNPRTEPKAIGRTRLREERRRSVNETNERVYRGSSRRFPVVVVLIRGGRARGGSGS